MAGIRTENKIYEVGIYCRLSKDDGTDNESASIATQKSILTDYVKRQGWHLAKTYVDDGYSGTNFQRPSFQNMIKDIENGLINCVITKDLSRLGRNYLDCGLYLEVFFPEHNVRYIAVNDGVDTLNKSAMDITPFRNILNEMYSADVSVKIKSAYRARFQQGKFMGTTAPYGYVLINFTSYEQMNNRPKKEHKKIPPNLKTNSEGNLGYNKITHPNIVFFIW